MPVMPTISFITANFVARARGYDGNPDWMVHDQATVGSASPERFLEVVQDLVAAGFDAVDVWTAHCHWRHHDREDYLEQVKGFCSQFDLTITSYAGGMDVTSAADLDAPLRFMKQLGAPLLAGGIRGLPPAELCAAMDDACRRYGVRWAYENHPEKTFDELLAKVDGGKHERVGVALDTGWCGTQGMDAVDAARRLHEMGKLFIVHLKDVMAAGKHDTCAIGDGIVPCEAVVRYLAKAGWAGDIAIEHEPYDRDPMPEIARSLERVRGWLKS
jgi:sugar phosphate isomerase/epimerase